MRTLSYAALALVAGLAVSGAARADQYTADRNREQYAVSAQGFVPGLTAARTTNQNLLPANAQPTAGTFFLNPQVQTANPQDQIVGPFSDKDAHSGPSHSSGTPSRL